MINKAITHLAVGINTVRPHPRNVRQGDIGAISQSLQGHGQYRPIIVQQSTGYIIAGNHTWKAAKSLNWQNIAVHYLDVDDEQALRIMLADNRTTDLSSYDDAALIDLLKELNETSAGLKDTMFDGNDLDDLIRTFEWDNDEANAAVYSQAVKVPQYEIVGPQPNHRELYDDSKYDSLLENIDKVDAPEEVIGFLRLAATRHIKWNYSKIAEYYPHATPEVQRLMEQSVLIIIDYEDAIANGFVRVSEALASIRHTDASHAE